GRILSQKSYNAIRKKQLEFNASFQGTSRLTARQKNFEVFSLSSSQEQLMALLTKEDIPGLEYPVIIGQAHEAVAIYTDKYLGHGASGVVYLGISLDTGKQYAVKVQEYKNTIKSKKSAKDISNETQLLDCMGRLVDNAPYIYDRYAIKNYDIQTLIHG